MQSSEKTERQDWMRVLALAFWHDLSRCAGQYLRVEREVLRPPETGLIMLRGRMGGTGSAFNMGETTVTRCAVRILRAGEGHAYVMGRNAEHALLAAICDGLLQLPAYKSELLESVVAPLREAKALRCEEQSHKAAATKVDFFTLVRGDV